MKEKAKKMNQNTRTTRGKNNGKSKAGSKARRVTRKEVYAKYGIVWDGKHIVSPVGPVCELLKEGNDKTGKLVYTFSLLPGTGSFTLDIDGTTYTVDGTCGCNCVGCYAMAGHYVQYTAEKSMLINTYLVNNHLDFVKACISAQLEYIGRGEIRIHAAGDFKTADPEAYAGMWHDVAARFNTFRFWTYTKLKKFETLFDDLKNANIVKSVIPGIGINYGHCDYIINAYYTLRDAGKKVYICRCGIDKNQHCENCGVCATYDYVLFIEHSTDYIAERDPLFGKLCEIINNQ